MIIEFDKSFSKSLDKLKDLVRRGELKNVLNGLFRILMEQIQLSILKM
jgi:hypothetical protein